MLISPGEKYPNGGQAQRTTRNRGSKTYRTRAMSGQLNAGQSQVSLNRNYRQWSQRKSEGPHSDVQGRMPWPHPEPPPNAPTRPVLRAPTRTGRMLAFEENRSEPAEK